MTTRNDKILDTILWQDKRDLIFGAKAWPHPTGTKLSALLQAPNDIRAAIIRAEIGLMQAATEQRQALDQLEQWLRQQQQEAQE